MASLIEFKAGFASATDGCRIHYEVHGNPQNRPVIIFQHGYTGSMESWRASLPYFTRHYACVLIDGRGCGKSDKTGNPENYHLEQYVRDVISVADHVAIGSFTYLGHSMGGAMGMLLATGAHRHRLVNLILLTPAPARGILDPQNTQEAVYQERKTLPFDDYVAIKRASYMRKEFIDADVASFQLVAASDLACPDQYYLRSWKAMCDLRVSDKLKDIVVPTLMIVGSCDGLLANNLHDYKRLRNATLHVFSRTAHYPNREIPEDFAKVVLDFLAHGPSNPATLFSSVISTRAALTDARAHNTSTTTRFQEVGTKTKSKL